MLAAALEGLIEPPLAVEAVLEGDRDRRRPDILIHRTPASPTGAVVELRRHAGQGAPGRVAAGLRQLDRYLDALPGACGALVFVGASPQDEGRPQVRFERSPAGRRVAVVEL
jgi:hypothetical protein